MNQSHINMPALLSMPFRPLRIWMINRALQQSDREVQVIRMQQKQLREEERAEHEKQVRLASKRRQLEMQ